MLSVFSRAYGTLFTTVGLASHGSVSTVSSVSSTVWTWIAVRGEDIASATQDIASNISTPMAATSRIVSAVRAHATDAAVGTASSVVPYTSHQHVSKPSRAGRCSWYCRRQKKRKGSRMTMTVEPSSPPRQAVYVKKRPIIGTKWAPTLTRLGQEHVGVVVTPMVSGSVPVTLCDSRPQTSYDFGPEGGKDFSLLKICDAEVRENEFPEGDGAFVGTTTKTADEIREFNDSYAKRYHLGVHDCRDYVSAFVEFTTGVRLEPATVSHYVNRVTRSSSLADAEVLSDDAAEHTPMHTLICGARAPFYLGLGF